MTADHTCLIKRPRSRRDSHVLQMLDQSEETKQWLGKQEKESCLAEMLRNFSVVL